MSKEKIIDNVYSIEDIKEKDICEAIGEVYKGKEKEINICLKGEDIINFFSEIIKSKNLEINIKIKD